MAKWPVLVNAVAPPTPHCRSSQPVQPWVKVQQTTFTKWVNNHIKDTGKEITDLQDDLKDGLILIHLMETLTGNDVQVRYRNVTIPCLHSMFHYSLLV